MLALTNVTASNAGSYSVVVSNVDRSHYESPRLCQHQ